MSNKLPWNKPFIHLLDARATASQNPDGPGTDQDAFFADPNGEGDLAETSETHTWIPWAGGNLCHSQFDS